MFNAYIKGADKAAYDQTISRHVTTTPFNGHPHSYMIGIENEAGQVYRALMTTSFGDYMHTVLGLREIGFADRLADQENKSPEGLDSRLHFVG